MNAAKVGFFTLLVLITLAVVITWKSNLLLMREGTTIVGTFPNIEGLTVGSEVRYRGFNIGQITRIDPTPQDIKTYAIIKKGILIPQDSTLRIAFDGIVGLKYLEIRPGTSEMMYSGKPLKGISTAGIVDFVDLAAQNLEETKKILTTIRTIIDDPNLQMAFKNAIFSADQVAENVEKLTQELRMTNAGIMKVTNDPSFQQAVKGTATETHKTLESANKFFDSFSKLQVKPSADIQYGSVTNIVRGNLDISPNNTDSLRIGVGEGPTRNIGLLDLEISKLVMPSLALRIGMINTFLGAGVDYNNTKDWVLSGDIYDIDNPKPKVPKFRATARYKMYKYSDILFQADDIFNSERNYLIGITIKNEED